MNKTRYRVLIKKQDLIDLDFPGVNIDNLPEHMEVISDEIIACMLTEDEYIFQLNLPNIYWRDPLTQISGFFDDDWYEENEL